MVIYFKIIYTVPQGQHILEIPLVRGMIREDLRSWAGGGTQTGVNHRREILTDSPRAQRKWGSSKRGGVQRPHTVCGSMKWACCDHGPNPGCVLESPAKLVYRRPPQLWLMALADMVPGIAMKMHPPRDPSVFSSLQTSSGTPWGPKWYILHTRFLNRQ